MQETTNIEKDRLLVISIFLYFFLFCFMMLLAYFQILQGSIFKNRAQQNQARTLQIPSYRSIIFDRNKEIKLAYNNKSLALTIIDAHLPSDAADREILFKRIADILQDTPENIKQTLSNQYIDLYTPITLRPHVPLEIIAKFAEKTDEFPGVYWDNIPKRVYTLKDASFHTVGYTGIMNKDEYNTFRNHDEYYLGSAIGKQGIERQYDNIIRGKSGTLIRSVNVKGQVLQQDVSKEPIQGDHVVLTIDAKLQAKASELMADKIGSVVVSRISTGEILTFLSSPSVDPIIFDSDHDKTRKEFRKLILDPLRPFLNRPIQGFYPPASSFKLISASAFLKYGIDPEKTVVCKGYYSIGNRDFKCNSKHGHGVVNLYTAIAKSCNVYFYHYSQVVGRKEIMQMAKEYGIDTPYQIDLPEEKQGFIPNEEWFRKTHKRRWSNGDTANIAIGQGDILMTPLGINMMTAMIGNNGVLYKPHIMKETLNPRNKEVTWFQKPIPIRTLNLNQDFIRMIQESMAMTVKPGGTAGWLTAYNYLKVPIAGKTGTAQAGNPQDHGIFTAYGPYGSDYQSDAIAVTVFLEYGRTGAAVTIAAELFNYYFKILHPEYYPSNTQIS